MNKIYFEMNDKEKELHHIATNLDYAICVFGEGLSGTGKFNLKNTEINKLQNRIGDHLMKAYEDITLLLKATEEKEIYLPFEEEDIEDDETEEEYSLNLHLVENVKKLGVLNNYQVEYMLESEDQEERKGVSILLKKISQNGVYKYRQLLFSGDGKQYISDEF